MVMALLDVDRPRPKRGGRRPQRHYRAGSGADPHLLSIREFADAVGAQLSPVA